MKRASIIIRVYNAQSTLKRSIESALAQNFPREEYEIIAVNDGSTDRSRSILKEYENKFLIQVIDQENQGGIVGANVGFVASRGKYVTLLDSDDELKTDFLKETIFCLEGNSQYNFVYVDYFEVKGSDSAIVSPKNIFQTLSNGIVYRKDDLGEAGWYKVGVFFAEYDLLLRTLPKWKGHHLKKPLFVYNRQPGSSTSNLNKVYEGLSQLREIHPHRLKEIDMIRPYN